MLFETILKIVNETEFSLSPFGESIFFSNSAWNAAITFFTYFGNRHAMYINLPALLMGSR